MFMGVHFLTGPTYYFQNFFSDEQSSDTVLKNKLFKAFYLLTSKT